LLLLHESTFKANKQTNKKTHKKPTKQKQNQQKPSKQKNPKHIQTPPKQQKSPSLKILLSKTFISFLLKTLYDQIDALFMY
jgi:Ca2+/H+ antiporter